MAVSGIQTTPTIAAVSSDRRWDQKEAEIEVAGCNMLAVLSRENDCVEVSSTVLEPFSFYAAYKSITSPILQLKSSLLTSSLGLFFLLFSTLVTALGCGVQDEGAAGGGPPPVSVETVELKPELLRDVAQLLGQLEAEESVILKPEIEGIVEAIEFSEGQTVSAGEVLFRLRDAEQRARLHEAEAALALARVEYQRTQTLAQRNIAAVAQVDRIAAERAAAEAQVELARVALERTRIRAPFDGHVADRLVSPGDRVDADTELLRVDATQRLRLIFSVPEAAVPRAHAGIPVELSVAAYPEEHFQGEVYFVSPYLNANNRRLLLKAWVPNPEGRLKPGMFVTLEAEVERRDAALVLPESAVVSERAGNFVWRVDSEGRAEQVPVELGIRTAGRVEVRSGLKAGDTVVVAGSHKLSPGAPVQGTRATPKVDSLPAPTEPDA